MHRVLSRLGRITQAMIRLARHDTTTDDPVARRSRRGRRDGARGRGVQGQRHPADRPRGRAQAAQPPRRHRAEQHDPRAVHVRCRAEPDRLQQDLCADVRADAGAVDSPARCSQAIENYRATIGNGAIANPEQVAAATAIRDARGLGLHPGADGRPHRRGVAAADAGRRLGRGARGHHRAPPRRGQDRASGAPRHADQSAEPRAVPRAARDCVRPHPAAAAASPCIASISITSRPSTTRSAIRSATSC